MNKIKLAKQFFGKFNYILTKRQKFYAVIIVIMSMIGAVFETLGVSVIIPLVSVIVNVDSLMKEDYIISICKIFNIHSTNKLITFLGIFICFIYLVKNLYLTLLSYSRAKYATYIQRTLSVKMMRVYMQRDYAFFTNINSSELIQGTNGDISGVYQMLSNAFKIVAELLTALAIIIMIIGIDVSLAVGTILLSGVCGGLIFIFLRKPMNKMGIAFRKNSQLVSKYGIEAFQGIKEIIVMHRQKFFVKRFEEATAIRQKATIGQTMAGECPAYVIETICVSGLITVVCLKMQQNNIDVASLIPQLAAYAVAAFRILPSLGRISSGFNQIMYYGISLDKVYTNCIEVENEEEQNSLIKPMSVKIPDIKEQQYLSLSNISWKYSSGEKNVLNCLNLEINRNDSIAFIGQSGAGKTTLADIILGLFKPQEGDVIFEGKSIFQMDEMWNKIVGYIPQSIYLLDDTIRDNVAFGIESSEVSDDLVWSALEQAQLKDFVESLPEKLNTVVGESGVRFSGGQRQRIAIARALYYNPEILIMDEATSALDTETENAVMEAIKAFQGKKTLIIVAHRLSTIADCNRIYEILNGKCVEKDKKEILNTIVTK